MKQSIATPTALGVSIFAGGFSLGVDRQFHVKAVFEESNYGVATARHNMPHIPIHVGASAWPVDQMRPVDFIYGNPPCAAWSPAGSKIKNTRHWQSDARVDCTRLHFSMLERLQPQAWAWESVPQAFVMGRSFVDELTYKALKLGYSVTYLLHNSEYLGVPQRRRRFFMVATRFKFDVLEPAWQSMNGDEALRGLNDPGAPLDFNIRKYPGLVVKPGETLISAWHRVNPEATRTYNARGHTVGRPAFTIKRMKIGEPAPVVMHEIMHPTQDRGLSIKELSILCGYPPDYEFIGARDAGQVGRGVCPPVGEWLAKNIKRCLKRNLLEPPTVRLIDVREKPMSVVELLHPGAPAMPSPPSTAQPAATSPPGRVSAAPGIGSGARIRQMLQDGMASAQILEIIHKEFPGSKAGPGDVAWNRAKLRKADIALPVVVKPLKLTKAQKASDAAYIESHEPFPVTPGRQPTMSKRVVPDREFDQTSLRANAHGVWIHRDFMAHFFRWGFAGRFIDSAKTVLDVGCGPDCMMVQVLTMPRNVVPKAYLGVDLNREPAKHPTRQWAEFKWGFNFVQRSREIKQKFDVVTCFEVIEHMAKPDGEKLLTGLRDCLAPDGTILLSTPVFSGKAAANHLHEYTMPELAEMIKKAKLKVVNRFGTFARQPAIKKVASPAELDVFNRLSAYYGGEVMSVFLAPLYPDVSSNNIWILKHA